MKTFLHFLIYTFCPDAKWKRTHLCCYELRRLGYLHKLIDSAKIKITHAFINILKIQNLILEQEPHEN